MTYAAELDGNGVVARVIVGAAEWASANLGGAWVDCPADCFPGVGWSWDGAAFNDPGLAASAEMPPWSD